jgi:ABC-type multidrug transport system fused ATPase/permease subunit
MYSKLRARQNAVRDAKNNLPGKEDPQFAQFEKELMAMARNDARQITSSYGPKLEVLNGMHKPLLKDYERISKDYDKHATKIGRSEPSVELTRIKYYALMLLFVLGEIPMNSLAFSVFGESQIFTWIMAVGVAVAIPWIAHAMGILFKRWSAPWWKNAIGIGTLLILTIGGLVAVGYVRVQYLGDLSKTGAVGSFGNSTVIGAAFVGLNLVILAAATLCSYFAHDQDPMLEHLHRRTNQLNKAMRAIEAKYRKILTKQQQKLHRIQQRTQEVIYHYRKINQRVRPDHEKPKSFEQDHELGVEFEKEDESRKFETETTRLKLVAAQSGL